MDQTIFGTAAEAGDGGAGKRLDKPFRKWPAKVSAVEREPGYFFALKIAGKAAHGCFDFG